MLAARLQIIQKLILTLWRQGLGILIPVVGVLIVVSVVIGILHVVSPIAPFVYSLF